MLLDVAMMDLIVAKVTIKMMNLAVAKVTIVMLDLAVAKVTIVMICVLLFDCSIAFEYIMQCSNSNSTVMNQGWCL